VDKHTTLFPQEVLLEQRMTDLGVQVSMGVRTAENKNTTEWRAVMSTRHAPSDETTKVSKNGLFFSH
jgi:hypothetical protein